jgi:hypothetical protein
MLDDIECHERTARSPPVQYSNEDAMLLLEIKAGRGECVYTWPEAMFYSGNPSRIEIIRDCVYAEKVPFQLKSHLSS